MRTTARRGFRRPNLHPQEVCFVRVQLGEGEAQPCERHQDPHKRDATPDVVKMEDSITAMMLGFGDDVCSSPLVTRLCSGGIRHGGKRSQVFTSIGPLPCL